MQFVVVRTTQGTNTPVRAGGTFQPSREPFHTHRTVRSSSEHH